MHYGQLWRGLTELVYIGDAWCLPVCRQLCACLAHHRYMSVPCYAPLCFQQSYSNAPLKHDVSWVH